MNINQIKELILLMDETNVAELEYEGPEFKISLRKGHGDADDANGAVHDKPIRRKGRKSEQEVPPQDDLIPVIAPMVGSFYRSPSPDAPPFVELDSYVEPGQTLCIVEAMKLMNEIKSEIRGKIVEILVENGQAVEYGQTMFLIAKE